MPEEAPQGTLIRVADANDVGVHQGLGDVGLGGLTAANIGQYYDQMVGTQTSQKELIEQATAALKRQRAPSLLGSLAQGLSQVQHQPGIAGVLANINSGLSSYDKAKSAFDEAQADKEMDYKLKSLELQGKMGATGLDRIRQLAALQEAQAKAKEAAATKAAIKTGALTPEQKTANNLDPKAPYFWKDDVPVLADAVKPPPLTPEEQANKAADVTEARILAADAAKAKTMLPKARSTANRALAGITSILNHPGLSAVVGLPDPTKGGFGFVQVPGTDAANFKARLDQLKGGAFLEAFTILKGGGPISNTEGTKAEAAIVRASAAQTEVEFRQAMIDFEDAIRTGLANLETSASGAAFDIGRAPPAAAAPAAAAPPVKTSTGAGVTADAAAQALKERGFKLVNGNWVKETE